MFRHSRSPDISSKETTFLSTKSSSRFWESLASSIAFLALDILLFTGKHDTGAELIVSNGL